MLIVLVFLLVIIGLTVFVLVVLVVALLLLAVAIFIVALRVARHCERSLQSWKRLVLPELKGRSV